MGASEEKAMMQIDEKAIERSARAICIAAGYKPESWADNEELRERCRKYARVAIEAVDLSSTGEADGWLDIASAPKNISILGWGPIVGKNLCWWNERLQQWSKVEVSARYQLGPTAITHWLPHGPPPSAMLAAAGGKTG